ncbi:DUF4178 domain-containing protein [Geomonas sp. Red32]|uniref:DUF4178 domain-containing protein n=1 Tax=Geomonas sp. Red32 TaxID=2912856 RepID=UPI00202CD2AB|nr:DUF4178 domain-containing protein [Geomonas sp. Red32]MCM0083028.1 DUF4178 domain-containing protein [Geomonas sp. Red32]
MNSDQLEQLAVGDSFILSGVQWAVRELNLFQDPSGYRTVEWRVQSSRAGEYYLMVEHDPAHPAGPIWYLSERLPSPKLIRPDTGGNVFGKLQETFSSHAAPPPALAVNGTTFLFESSSSGTFTSDGETQHRSTWEYWDQTHSRNLALEFWDDGNLLVYQARTIRPESVITLQKGGAKEVPDRFFGQSKPGTAEWICALALTIIGLMMFFAGISRP